MELGDGVEAVFAHRADRCGAADSTRPEPFAPPGWTWQAAGMGRPLQLCVFACLFAAVGCVINPVPTPGPGEVLTRTLWLSVDPYMRGRLWDRASYAAPVQMVCGVGSSTDTALGAFEAVRAGHPQSDVILTSLQSNSNCPSPIRQGGEHERKTNKNKIKTSDIDKFLGAKFRKFPSIFVFHGFTLYSFC